MSDARVDRTLDDLEVLLERLAEAPDPAAVAAWHRTFSEAVAAAERGPEWPRVVARAHDLSARLDALQRHLKAVQGAVREELLASSQGQRALKGYRPS